MWRWKQLSDAQKNQMTYLKANILIYLLILGYRSGKFEKLGPLCHNLKENCKHWLGLSFLIFYAPTVSRITSMKKNIPSLQCMLT